MASLFLEGPCCPLLSLVGVTSWGSHRVLKQSWKEEAWLASSEPCTLTCLCLCVRVLPRLHAHVFTCVYTCLTCRRIRMCRCVCLNLQTLPGTRKLTPQLALPAQGCASPPPPWVRAALSGPTPRSPMAPLLPLPDPRPWKQGPASRTSPPVSSLTPPSPKSVQALTVASYKSHLLLLPHLPPAIPSACCQLLPQVAGPARRGLYVGRAQ